MVTRLSKKEWLSYVEDNVRADFEKGLLFWKKPLKGRQLQKPLGTIDSNGYRKVSIGGRACYAHRVIYYLFYKRWPSLIDHDNRNPSDNRISNLIDSNHSDNAMNSGLWATNTSGVRGVSITKYGNYKVTKKGLHKGTFKTMEEAINAYNN